MSNAARLAAILKRLGDAHYQAADELIALATEQPQRAPAVTSAAGGSPSSAPADTFSDGVPVEEPPLLADGFDEIPGETPSTWTGPSQGSLENCPKHRKPYKDGRYGKFCTSTTDDSAWGKERDGRLWCSITPKNADKWLKVQAAA